MIMYNNFKYFSGQIRNEVLAGMIYDRYALQTMGIRAKTNFSYTSDQVKQLIRDMEAHIIEKEQTRDKKSILLKGTFLVPHCEAK